jgi:hypothetical protein
MSTADCRLALGEHTVVEGQHRWCDLRQDLLDRPAEMGLDRPPVDCGKAFVEGHEAPLAIDEGEADRSDIVHAP